MGCLLASVATGPSAAGQTLGDASGPDLSMMSLGQLGALKVSTVSKKEEPLWQAASAVSVVTSDDIGSFGSLVIPEALRYVPGLEVAQIDSHEWAVSARGSDSRYANLQLVLEDGRTIYSPFSGGVYWEVAGPPVEEIAQVEVIRGPGATVWGANAVGGVINIVTRSARKAQGAEVSVGGGSDQTWSTYAGYGFQPGDHTWARIYGEVLQGGAGEMPNGQDAKDSWDVTRAGLSIEHDLSDFNRLTLQSEVSSGRFNDPSYYPQLVAPTQQIIPSASRLTDAHVLGRWELESPSDSKLTLQAFWSREEAGQFRDDFADDTFDLDLTHQLKLGDRQSVVWGGGVRLVTYDLDGKVGVVFPDRHPRDEVANAFFQDEIELVPRQLSLTVGTKIEHNNVTGLELEPSARLTWVEKEQTLWAAVSRSVHTPSVLERDIRYDAEVIGAPPTVVREIAEGGTGNDVQISYELGYRVQPVAQLSLDATVFYNHLPYVQAYQVGAPFAEATPAPFHFVLPLQFGKQGLRGESHGAELSLQWTPRDNWRWFADYSYLGESLDTMPGLVPFGPLSPRSRLGIRSTFDFSSRLRVDAGVRYVSAMPGTQVAGYLVGDLRLAWRPTDQWEFSLVGQNLLDSPHLEFPPSVLSQAVEVSPRILGKITWRFK